MSPRIAVVLPAMLSAVTLGVAALAPITANADDSVFSPTRQVSLRGGQVRVHADDMLLVRANLDRARDQLATQTTVDLPRPDGSTESFEIHQTSVMEPALAADQSQVQTYRGRSLDEPGTTVALDITQMGFHAAVRTASGSDWYLDPAYDEPGTALTASYYTTDVSVPAGRGLIEEGELRQTVRRAAAQGETAARSSTSVTQHVYRLALSNDPTYAAYFGAENVDAEKATLINRVNQIYNDDFGVQLVLVDDNSLLNFATHDAAYGTDGPCGGPACWEEAIDLPGTENDEPDQLAYCGYDTLGRNTAVIGQIIGSDNYDVGHLVLGTDGGGLADLGVVGWTRKGDGCTGLPAPRGDYMAIDYVAHELGHQFGANHTFAGTLAACGGGNRNGATSVEPGSGSSVMAYAGICGKDNLQKHSDPYFSQRSRTEITGYINSEIDDSVEIQSVALSGVSDGTEITLGYPGAGSTQTLTVGTTYTKAGVKAAISALTGVPTSEMVVSAWGFDPWGFGWPDEPEGTPDEHGFQVMFTPHKNPEEWPKTTVDLDTLTVSVSTGTADVAEVSTGGPVSAAGQQIASANTRPTISTGGGFTVPVRTPFLLTATASDADGDPYVVLWEQNDRGPGGSTAYNLFSQRKVSGPLFRVFGKTAKVTNAGAQQTPSPGQNHATASGERFLPNLRQVLDNNTNAVTGKCPTGRGRAKKVACFSEFLPTAAYLGAYGGKTRVMHFRATVRDRNPITGGTAVADTEVRVATNAGPFRVTSHNKGGSVKAGSRIKVTWKVNGTRALSKKVRIYLLNSATLTRVKLASTANDGTAVVRLPATPLAKARIMVMAQNAGWYDLNNRNIKVT